MKTKWGTKHAGSKYNRYFCHDFQQIKHIMADITIQVPETEYNSILRQAVAVIDKARNIVADEVEAFGKELPYRIEFPLLDSEHNKDEN